MFFFFIFQLLFIFSGCWGGRESVEYRGNRNERQSFHHTSHRLVKEIPPFLILSSAANKKRDPPVGTLGRAEARGREAAIASGDVRGNCRFRDRFPRRRPDCHAGRLGSHGKRPACSARRVSGLRHAPVDRHCSGGNVAVVAPGPRLLHTWMLVGCFSAARLHPKASRARGI